MANLSIAQPHFRSTANNVEIVIPVPQDADSPKFKTTIGKKDSYPVKLIMQIDQLVGDFYKFAEILLRPLQVCPRAECSDLDHQVLPRRKSEDFMIT